MDIEYSQAELEEILGIKGTKLKSWIKTGLVEPFKGTAKRGFTNQFNAKDLYIIKLLEIMIARGYSRKKIGKMFDVFREYLERRQLPRLPTHIAFIFNYSDESPFQNIGISVHGFCALYEIDKRRISKGDEVCIINFGKVKTMVDAKIVDFEQKFYQDRLRKNIS